MAAYRISLLDGRNRDHLTREELIFDPDTGKGSIWSFRFKEAAGSDWTAFDPWYKYQPCRKMVFLEDGKVKMYVTRKKTWEGKEQHMTNVGQMGTAGRIINESSREEQLENMGTKDSTIQGASLLDPRYNQVRPENGVYGADLQDPAVPMTWRFVNQALDLPNRPVGSYIRFSVRGREVPTYVCRRSPTNNWGFVMESCWGVYASFELPPRHRVDNNSRVARRRRYKQRMRRSLNLAPVENGDDALVCDDNFNVTTELQWREVYLYNNFAFRLLPEGSDALVGFGSAYGI